MSAQADKWLSDVNALVARFASYRVLFLATTGTQAEVGARVWDEGGTTDGQPIGYLEDYEVWAYKPPAPRAVSGRGKPDAKGKRAKIKGGYYETYLGFKAAMGRRDTPLDLTGEFRKGYFSATALVESDGGHTVDIVLRGDNVDKWKGLTDQKGEFLLLSPKERASHVERLRDIWQRTISGEEQ